MKSKLQAFLLSLLFASYPLRALADTPRPIFASSIYNGSGILYIPTQTPLGNRACLLDQNNTIGSSVTTSTELSYVHGVTSSIQAQINTLGSAITSLTGDGTATGPGASVLTLATVATPGTFPKVTFNAKGLVTSGTPLVSGDIPNNAANTSGSAGSFTGALTGDVTGTQSATAISASTVMGKAITGFVSGAGSVSSADTLISAIDKLDGNTTAFTSQKGQPNGLATLDGSGVLPSSQVPPVAIGHTYVVGSQAAMLALSANVGDVAVRTDISQNFILQTSPPGTLGNWVELLTPAAPVQSVNGQTGTVSLTTTNISEGSNLYFTTSRAQGAVSASSPLTYSLGVFGCQAASGSQAGCLSSTDWSTFNGKQSALSFGNLTDVGTDGISLTGGTGAVIGSGTAISQHVADSTHNGYLASSDWSTFNGKQAALSFGNLTDVGTDGITITSGTGAVIGSGTSVSQHVADATHSGYLASSDWSTFNGKQASGSYITALTSDVSAAGPGSVAATVNSVGGSTASLVHSAELAANAATSANTVSTIMARDGSGQVAATTFTGALSGNATTATTATSATTATTATNATNVATTSSTTNASFFPLFVASSTNGNQAASLGTNFTFNPSTNLLSLGGGGLFSSVNGSETTVCGMSSSTRYTCNNTTHANSTFLTYATNTNYVGLGVGTFPNDWYLSINGLSSNTTPITSLIPNTTNAPLLVLHNADSTIGNWGGVGFTGSTDKITSAVVGVNDNQTAAAEAGHLEFEVTNAGTRANAMKINKDKSLVFAGYGTGLIHSDSSGNITSSAVDLSGADATGTLAAGRFPALTGDITTSAGAVATTLKNTGTSGTYTKVTTDAQGRVSSGTTAAFSDLSGSVAASQMPALTGDITTSAGAVATSLATVNSNVGTFGDSSHVAQVTVNAKGLVTAASSVSTTVVTAPPTVQTFTATGSATYNKDYTFVISSGNATVGATYTNNSITYTVYATVASATQVVMSGSGAPTSSGTLTKASGTGDATLTFSQVLAPISLEVTLVGAGGGGGGAGNAGGNNGTAGGDTTFGTSLLTANGGAATSGQLGGVGGSFTIALPAHGIGKAGGDGQGAGVNASASVNSAGGQGAASCLGGNGGGGQGASTVGTAAKANSGSGGGGGGGSTAYSGPGGSAGGCILGAVIANPSATYSVSVGAKGTGGTHITNGSDGGNGADGFIAVVEHYQ